jgi:hypothetical protein
VPRETPSSRARSSIGGSWLSGGYSPLAILSRRMRSTLLLGRSGSLPCTCRSSHDRSIAYGEYRLDIQSIVYNHYKVSSWADQQLAILRPKYPAWDLWVVRLTHRGGSIWCARPAGSKVATINVGSPEELIAAIAEQEAAR